METTKTQEREKHGRQSTNNSVKNGERRSGSDNNCCATLRLREYIQHGPSPLAPSTGRARRLPYPSWTTKALVQRSTEKTDAPGDRNFSQHPATPASACLQQRQHRNLRTIINAVPLLAAPGGARAVHGDGQTCGPHRHEDHDEVGRDALHVQGGKLVRARRDVDRRWYELAGPRALRAEGARVRTRLRFFVFLSRTRRGNQGQQSREPGYAYHRKQEQKKKHP